MWSSKVEELESKIGGFEVEVAKVDAKYQKRLI
jgi:hypothetical protein